MFQKIFGFLSVKTDTHKAKPGRVTMPIPQPNTTTSAPHYDDSTRPSYRIGKHKSSDIHKALDMAG